MLRVTSGLCTASAACVDSPNLPLGYAPQSACTIIAETGLPLTATQFDTASGDELDINGEAFNRTHPPIRVVTTSAPIHWRAAARDTEAGRWLAMGHRWQLCVDGHVQLPPRLLALQATTLLLHCTATLLVVLLCCCCDERRDGGLAARSGPRPRTGWMCLAIATFACSLAADAANLWLTHANVYTPLPSVAAPLEYATAATDLVALVFLGLACARFSRATGSAADGHTQIAGPQAAMAREEMARPFLAGAT